MRLLLMLFMLSLPLISTAPAAAQPGSAAAACTGVVLLEGTATRALNGVSLFAAGYVANLTDDPVTLIGAQSAEAALELSPDADLTIPPRAVLDLGRDGLGLTAPLPESGQPFDLTLSFDAAPAVAVALTPGAAPLPVPLPGCDQPLLLATAAYPNPTDVTAGVINGLLYNLTPTDDLLLAVQVDGGTAQITPLSAGEDALPIASGRARLLTPETAQIMLQGLAAPLVGGETLALTLTFAEAGDVRVSVPVAAVPALDQAAAETVPVGVDAALWQQGRDLYHGGAAGIGCAVCHAADAGGSFGRDIRGIDADAVRQSLTSVPEMLMLVNLTDAEIEALAVYLGALRD
ncbi:MAG: copper chaperone PCu(A)C [Chloroflexi bacterium]|nr:copper chaperone PCu(A)C [Chloroflexota bacterium]